MKYQTLIRRVRRGAHGGRLYLGIVVTISAAACAPSPDPTHQTVEYYRTNREARAAKMAECANDPGALGKTPDCINAHRAEQMDAKRLRDLPPMGLARDLEKRGLRQPDGALGDPPRSSDEETQEKSR